MTAENEYHRRITIEVLELEDKLLRDDLIGPNFKRVVMTLGLDFRMVFLKCLMRAYLMGIENEQSKHQHSRKIEADQESKAEA